MRGPLFFWWKGRKLRSSDKEERRRCIHELGQLRDPRTVPLLLEALDDPDLPVASLAAEALGRAGDPRALPPLVAAVPRIGSDAVRGLRTLDRSWKGSDAYR